MPELDKVDGTLIEGDWQVAGTLALKRVIG